MDEHVDLIPAEECLRIFKKAGCNRLGVSDEIFIKHVQSSGGWTRESLSTLITMHLPISALRERGIHPPSY
jgi:hypothetical protein